MVEDLAQVVTPPVGLVNHLRRILVADRPPEVRKRGLLRPLLLHLAKQSLSRHLTGK